MHDLYVYCMLSECRHELCSGGPLRRFCRTSLCATNSTNAQEAFAGTEGGGRYTDELSALSRYSAFALNGTCTALPQIRLKDGGKAYDATVTASAGLPRRVATITDDKYLLVHDAEPRQS